MDRQLIFWLMLIPAVLSAQYTDYGYIRLYNSGKAKIDSFYLSSRNQGGLIESYPYRDAYGSGVGFSLFGSGGAYEYSGIGFIDSVTSKGWGFSHRTGKVTASDKRILQLWFYDGSNYRTISKWDSIGNYFIDNGYLDSDSIRDDATTRATSGTWHSGIGAWSLGNISTGSINSNGNSITGGAGSFTTGTFSSTITQTGNATGNILVNNSTGSPIVANVYSTSATTQPQIQFNRARGTSNTSYNAVNSGDVLGGMFASGSVNTTTFSASVGAIRVLAKENFGTTANGTYIDFATTQNGATSRTVDMVLDKDNSLPRLTVGTTAGTGTGNLYIDSLYFGTTLAIDANRKHTNVGGIATTGAFGVAPQVDTVTYTSMSSGMSKNLTSTAGMYRLLYTIFCTTADAAAGSVQLTLSFNNGAAQTMTSAAVNLTSTANKDDDAFIFYVASGTPSISTAITGSAGTSKYSVHAVVERLK